ncbi:hypothetical protein F2P56_030426 [Juglans regia]|uniref:Reverse transcriptase Ty1/copia-type domain-containing protein n=1 Tax=Juglans regia TaxID=51240 RepID=A0A833UES0_JUGRE|nr:hypothetical protein F2P56_030426 [Juglans regia]
MVKASTVRVVLSLAVTYGWHLRQLDVKNAFLNGILQEHVYMEQPPSYVDPRFPHHSCGYLFIHSPSPAAHHLPLTLHSAASLRICHQGFGIPQLFSWSRSHSHLDRFFSQLDQVCTQDIFAHAQLLDYKPVTTPMVVAQRLSSNGSRFEDVTLYRSLIGALQYLTITHPDLAHSVYSVSQYLHAPTDEHFQAVKRIIRYSIYLVDNLVSWSAKKQPTVSRSNCESEYRALASIVAEVLWLDHLLRDLHVSTPLVRFFYVTTRVPSS